MATRASLIRRWVFGCLLVGTGIAVVWLASQAPAIDDLLPTGALRIGVDASFPPFAVFDDSSYRGIDIALGEALAQELGVAPQFVNLGHDGLYDALATGRVDVLLSALTERPELRGRVRYTHPYFNAGLVLVTPATDGPSPTMWQMAGHRIAFGFGSDAHFELNAWTRRIRSFTLLPYELPEYALDALRLGQADAALIDSAHLLAYQCRYPDWRVTQSEVTVLPYVIAVDGHNPYLHQRLDAALRQWLSTGRVDALIRAQFSSQCWTALLPRRYTAAS